MIYQNGRLINECLNCDSRKFHTHSMNTTIFNSTRKVVKVKKSPVYNKTFNDRDKIRNLHDFLECSKIEGISFYSKSYQCPNPRSAGFIMSMQFRTVVHLIDAGLYIYHKKGN